MSTFATEGCDYYRSCDSDITMDPITFLPQHSNHGRQNNVETYNLSSCAYEQSNNKINQVGHPSILQYPLNEPSFQYSYSPQTEPSNLSLVGTPCSPLNLTGRSKSESPLQHESQNASSHFNYAGISSEEINIPTQINYLQNLPLPNSNALHSNYTFPNIGLYSNCSQNLQQPLENIQLNTSMPTYVDEIEESNFFNLVRKRKKIENLEFDCTMCSRTFHSKELLNHHLVMCHQKNGNRLLVPNECQPLVRMETIHMNHSVHSASSYNISSMPYKCSTCDQEFSFKEELAQHNDEHLASKPYKCEICGTGLSHLSALKRHSLTHSGHKPHTCEICGRSFFQKCDLQRHSVIHNKKREVDCTKCKRKFSSGAFLRNHKCTPPEEPKPFKCEICGEGCANNIAWGYHMWKHTKDPIFVPCNAKILNPQYLSNKFKSR